MKRLALMLACSGSAMFGGGVTHAQVAAELPADAQTSVAEVVVTAQRREERLQDVPIAVTAVGQTALEQMRVSNFVNLSGVAPNVQINGAGQQSSQTTVIRGILSGTANNAVDPKAGIYLDGVYIGRSVGSAFDLADLERVEVLRGPQGTLFGRNATAGAISLITAGPTGEFGARGTVSLGNDEARRAKLAVDLPQVGPLALKISYLHDEIEGDAPNLIGRRSIDLRLRDPDFGVLRYADRLGSRDTDGVQVAAQADFGQLIADYRFDYTASETTARAFQSFGVVPDATGALLAGIVAFQPVTGGVTNISDSRLDAVANASSVEKVVTQGHNFTLTYDVSDSLTLKSITAFRKFRQDPTITDLASTGGMRFSAAQFAALLNGNIAGPGGVLDPASAPGPNDSFFSLLTARSTSQRQFSQELQAQWETERVQVTAGAFYFHENSPATDILGIFQPVVDGVVIPIHAFDALFGSGVTRTRAINDSYAIYSQATAKVTDSVDLTLGLRYTRDDRETQIYSISGGQGGSLGAGNYNASFDKLNYLVNLSWRPQQDMLVYGKVSTGYVAGGVLSGIPYEPEDLTSYEAGIKADFFDKRLRTNLAAFYSKYKNMQVQDFADGRQVFTNAGAADIAGFELEVEAVPAPGLSLSGNLGYTDVSFDRFVVSGVDIADDARVMYLPKWTARVAVDYSAPAFANGARPVAAISARYRSEAPLTLTPIRDLSGALSPLDAFASVDSFWLVDARIGLSRIDVGGGELDVSIFGNNLLDEEVNTYGATVLQLITSYDRGRTYGLSLSARF